MTAPHAPRMPMGRRLFLIATSSLVLAACGNILGPPDAPQMYALRPVPPPAQSGGKVSWALAILKPDAPDNLDSSRIALARSDTQLDYYASASWPDRLPALVQTALLAGFEATGRIDSVTRDEDALHADYQLSADLRDFEARYAAADSAPGVAVTIVAHMAEVRSRKIVANLTVTLSEPAAANSLEAVVQAFDVALAKAVFQITQWALSLPGPPPTP
jgi:cholesterol transport system auxiliary component